MKNRTVTVEVCPRDPVVLRVVLFRLWVRFPVLKLSHRVPDAVGVSQLARARQQVESLVDDQLVVFRVIRETGRSVHRRYQVQNVRL